MTDAMSDMFVRPCDETTEDDRILIAVDQALRKERQRVTGILSKTYGLSEDEARTLLGLSADDRKVPESEG